MAESGERHREGDPRRRPRRGAGSRDTTDVGIRHRAARGRRSADAVPLLARCAGAPGRTHHPGAVRGRAPRRLGVLARRARRRPGRDGGSHPDAAAGRQAARDRPRAVRAVHPAAARHQSARHPSRDLRESACGAGCRIRPRRRPRPPRGHAAADRPVRRPVRTARRGLAAARALEARAARRGLAATSPSAAVRHDAHQGASAAFDGAERGPAIEGALDARRRSGRGCAGGRRRDHRRRTGPGCRQPRAAHGAGRAR